MTSHLQLCNDNSSIDRLFPKCRPPTVRAATDRLGNVSHSSAASSAASPLTAAAGSEPPAVCDLNGNPAAMEPPRAAEPPSSEPDSDCGAEPRLEVARGGRSRPVRRRPVRTGERLRSAAGGESLDLTVLGLRPLRETCLLGGAAPGGRLTVGETPVQGTVVFDDIGDLAEPALPIAQYEGSPRRYGSRASAEARPRSWRRPDVERSLDCHSDRGPERTAERNASCATERSLDQHSFSYGIERTSERIPERVYERALERSLDCRLERSSESTDRRADRSLGYGSERRFVYEDEPSYGRTEERRSGQERSLDHRADHYGA
ncbi:uncharacterized protein LOC122383685 [Amphibalanus amphitrite]|uniref:uncharacterized protein LOC122383685 n=1 Tax=Amphibalanus amphitrite TaxID=1232801 RepID=UPI001C911F69|nr:uncharacterized protein LOC122383685 [Amphibalanus amphitrite]